MRKPRNARRCFTAHARELDGIIVCLPNFGEETGVADAIRMSGCDVPILVQACPDDLDLLQLENRRDAFCGKLSLCNNLYQYGMKYSLTRSHVCAVDGEEFHADVDRFAKVCAVVKAMRTARIGQIGARVMPFRTVRYSEKLLQSSGITVETEDFSEILADIAQLTDEAQIDAKIREIEAYGNVCAGIGRDKLVKQAKLCIAIENWMRAARVPGQRHPVLGQRGSQLRLRDVPEHVDDGRKGQPVRLRNRRDGRDFHARAAQGDRRAADLPGLEQQLCGRGRQVHQRALRQLSCLRLRERSPKSAIWTSWPRRLARTYPSARSKAACGPAA